jgi:hypothetical protein
MRSQFQKKQARARYKRLHYLSRILPTHSAKSALSVESAMYITLYILNDLCRPYLQEGRHLFIYNI